MKAQDYKNERIVIKNCQYPQFNGKATLITGIENHPTFGWHYKTELLIPNSELPLWIFEDNIDHIKQFRGYITQYQTMDGKTITKEIPNDENGSLSIIGIFDIFEKIYPN